MDPVKTGSLIASARRRKNLTQLQLAEQLHVTDRAVSKWERGRSFPDVGQLEPLCEALGLSLNELIRGEEAKEGDEAATPHELLSLTGELLRRKELRLRLLSAILAVILLLLAGTAVYRACNDPSRPAAVNMFTMKKPNERDKQLSHLLEGVMCSYDYTLRRDVKEIRCLVQVWTPDGLYSEKQFWKDEVGTLIPYRGAVYLKIANRIRSETQQAVVLGLYWKDTIVDMGNEIPLPEGRYNGGIICPYMGNRKETGSAVPLASSTVLKRDFGFSGIPTEETEQLQESLNTLQPGEQPPVPEDGVSVICWLELIPEQ